jgi:hypothetical protein
MCRRFNARTLVGLLALVGYAHALDIPRDLPDATHPSQKEETFRWVVTPIEGGAEIFTLMGSFSPIANDSDRDEVPLVAVLRDSLGNGNPDDDRLRYVWLLTYRAPSVKQRVLSAVPFLYWSVGAGGHRTQQWSKPLADLSDPTHPVWRQVGHNIMQWAAFDPLMKPVRASSRSFRTNGSDYERLNIEEAISFLRRAPAGYSEGSLTSSELTSISARLTLTKNLLGGLASESQLDRVAADSGEQRAASIGRNWELLRTSAERTGLIFESMNLMSSTDEYAMLWFPKGATYSAPGISLDKTWKLLHVRNPWRDERLDSWQGYEETRYLDENGALLPEGTRSSRPVTLVPLGVYSLTYPHGPLVMVDFRDKSRPRRRELVQRALNDTATGVLALSHFANWYYFAGSALYEFVKGRRGDAVDRAERLDSYAAFRRAISLDRRLDPALRNEISSRVNKLSINPLETSPELEIETAYSNFAALEAAAADGRKLPAKLEKDRREELAGFGASHGTQLFTKVLHYGSLGLYTKRAPQGADNLAALDRNRRIDGLMKYLDNIAASDSGVEMRFDTDRIKQSLAELPGLVQQTSSPHLHRHAGETISRIQEQTTDVMIAEDCRRALASLNAPSQSLQLETTAIPKLAPTRDPATALQSR